MCLLTQRGKGGQVFTLTQFNEGCVLVCVCFCAAVFPWRARIQQDGYMNRSFVFCFNYCY